MADGTKIRIDAKEFWRQVEADNLALGEDELKKLVQANFDKSVKPQGSKGLNINYSLMDASEESVAELLEVIGVRRQESAFGRDLMMPFTEGVAQDALISQIALNGGMVEEIARQQIKDAKPLSKLPLNMVMVKRMKMDSTRHYADALEDAADLIETFGLSPEQKRDWLRASQWAHMFEQLDAVMPARWARP